MAAFTPNTTQYGLQDIVNIYNELSAAPGGMMAGTVFSPSLNAYQYDSLASTAAMQRQAYTERLMPRMVGQTQIRRQAGMSASLGLGTFGNTLLNGARAIDPGLVDTLGHNGINDAVQGMIASSNAIGYTRSGRLGGVMNPQQLNQNMMAGASLSALSFRNNFNSDGTVDISQTHGLSLPVASYIGSRVLSERSQYESWAARMQSKDSGSLSAEEMKMTEREISNFKDGIGTTERAERSFNAQIKGFTEQVNKLVSSISKMTGGYTEAIEFMQRVTGGKAFAAGKDADTAREKAARLAMNMRVIAADAGIDSTELFAGANMYAAAMGYQRGFDSRTIAFNANPSDSRIGASLAAAEAKWMQMHPGATPDDIKKARASFESQVIGVGSGDMINGMTVIAADLVRGGMADEKRVRNILKSGDANAMHQYLQKFYSEDQLVELYGDKRGLEALRSMNADLVSDFDSIATLEGASAEKLRRGRRNGVESMMTRFASLHGRATGRSSADIRGGMNEAYKKAMLSKDALISAGLSGEAAQALIDTANAKNLDVDGILSHIRDAGGDVGMLEMQATQGMVNYVRGTYGDDSAAVKMLNREYEELYGGNVSIGNDYRAAYKALAEEGRNTAISDLAARIKVETDPEKRRAMMAKLSGMTSDAIAGKNGLMFTDEGYLKTLFRRRLDSSKLKSATAQEKENAVNRAYSVYKSAIVGGASVDKAFAAVSEESEYGAAFSGLDNMESRMSAFGRAGRDKKATDVTSEFVKSIRGLGIEVNDDELQEIQTKIYKGFNNRDKRFEGASDEMVLSTLLREQFASKISAGDKVTANQIDSILTALGVGGGILGETALRSDLEFKASGLGISSKEISDAIDKIYAEHPEYANDQGKMAELVSQTVGGSISPEAVRQMAARKAYGMAASRGNRNTIFGMSSGNSSSVAAFYENAASADIADAMALAGKQLGSIGSALTVQDADMKDAIRLNKQFGAGEFDEAKKRLYAEYGVDKLYSDTTDTKNRILRQLQGEGKIKDENDLAQRFAEFHTANKDLDESEYFKKFDSMFLADASGTLKQLSDHRKISAKEFVASVVAGAGKSGKEREDAEKAGFVTQRLVGRADNPDGLSNVEKYLLDIKAVLESASNKLPS